MGFMYRQQGNFPKALELYLALIKESPNNRGVYRELASVYRAIEEYDSFKAYAKYNYLHDPNNPYHIQPYFEALIFSNDIMLDEQNDMQNILKTIEIINSQSPLIAYYEIKSLYYSHIEHSRDKAIDILREGETYFADSSYIYRALFDCYELYKDIDGMKSVIKKLKKFQNRNRVAEIALARRQIILDAYLKKYPIELFESQIYQINGYTDEAKSKLLQKVISILTL